MVHNRQYLATYCLHCRWSTCRFQWDISGTNVFLVEGNLVHMLLYSELQRMGGCSRCHSQQSCQPTVVCPWGVQLRSRNNRDGGWQDALWNCIVTSQVMLLTTESGQKIKEKCVFSNERWIKSLLNCLCRKKQHWRPSVTHSPTVRTLFSDCKHVINASIDRDSMCYLINCFFCSLAQCYIRALYNSH